MRVIPKLERNTIEVALCKHSEGDKHLVQNQQAVLMRWIGGRRTTRMMRKVSRWTGKTVMMNANSDARALLQGSIHALNALKVLVLVTAIPTMNYSYHLLQRDDHSI